ncbi:MAG: hypothetical protein E6Q46_04895 [Flavobacterium sp.]|nr:MAG: hypothetical protein E6Q46_04895 [Flavobacterium sp.]
MKKSILLTILCSSILFLSCSSDDENGNNGTNFEIPLNNNNYWTYDVDSEGTLSRDSLYISGDVVFNTKTYKKFQTKDDAATGFYSSSLRNNGVRKSDSKLLLSGDLSLAPGQNLPINLDLSLDDFVIFNSNASNNQALNNSAVTGSINETVNGYPLTINYSLQSYGGETLSTFATNDVTYSNVKSTKIKLNVSITTVITVLGSPQTITALAAQDVLVSTQYLADGIGVVYTNTVSSYNINSFIADEFGVPSTNTQTQEEFLDTYLVN